MDPSRSSIVAAKHTSQNGRLCTNPTFFQFQHNLPKISRKMRNFETFLAMRHLRGKVFTVLLLLSVGCIFLWYEYNVGHEKKTEEHKTERLKALHVYFWDGTISGAWELQYIVREILPGIGRPLIYHWNLNNEEKDKGIFSKTKYALDDFGITQGIVDDALIIAATETQGGSDLDRVATVITKAHKNVGLLHIGDEHGGSKYVDLVYPTMSYIIRPFYFRNIWEKFPDKIIWVPNGYKGDVGPVRNPFTELPKVRERGLPCFFIGASTHESRKVLIEELSKIEDCIIAGSGGGGSGLPGIEYSFMLRNTIFAPCPWGHNKETFRFYESLENGAIPIIVNGSSHPNEHFDVLFEGDEEFHREGKTPFFEFEDWQGVGKFIRDSIHSSALDRLQAKQDYALQWWNKFKIRKANQIRKIVSQSFERKYHKPC
eukprot:TRINITY_DN792_c0_g1_i2.p1 TRINITY_DN792_c0_g1~~TRINITY_DN792_c0_g1_i2.p1  ORF type:complete len:429 (-),score=46.84 TRINITY_DN792_c0_g1_i2:264-1550(-)